MDETENPTTPEQQAAAISQSATEAALVAMAAKSDQIYITWTASAGPYNKYKGSAGFPMPIEMNEDGSRPELPFIIEQALGSLTLLADALDEMVERQAAIAEGDQLIAEATQAKQEEGYVTQETPTAPPRPPAQPTPKMLHGPPTPPPAARPAADPVSRFPAHPDGAQLDSHGRGPDLIEVVKIYGLALANERIIPYVLDDNGQLKKSGPTARESDVLSHLADFLQEPVGDNWQTYQLTPTPKMLFNPLKIVVQAVKTIANNSFGGTIYYRNWQVSDLAWWDEGQDEEAAYYRPKA